MPMTAPRSGTTTGKREAARTSEIAAWACTETGCTWRPPTTTWSRSMLKPERSAGTNPSPAYTAQSRGKGDNLYTCAIVAINIDTGKMVWYYQTSPHDTHDWDSAQTPVLVDAEFNGRPRKLLLTASRNGYYFTLDRLTGEHLVTSKFSDR